MTDVADSQKQFAEQVEKLQAKVDKLSKPSVFEQALMAQQGRRSARAEKQFAEALMRAAQQFLCSTTGNAQTHNAIAPSSTRMMEYATELLYCCRDKPDGARDYFAMELRKERVRIMEGVVKGLVAGGEE